MGWVEGVVHCCGRNAVAAAAVVDDDGVVAVADDGVAVAVAAVAAAVAAAVDGIDGIGLGRMGVELSCGSGVDADGLDGLVVGLKLDITTVRDVDWILVV